MPLYSLTYEKIEELRNKLKNKEEELENLMGITEKEMWKNELDELVVKYNEFLKSFEENKTKPVVKKTGKATKKV
jgi:DNA topoisomerase-2